MNSESATPSLDARLAALAGRQYGIVTRAQLLGLGIGETGIRERLRTGRLHRLHRGVYAVGHTVMRSEAYWLAAVLACGAGAVLSHASAAAHWNLRRSAAALIDVTVPSKNGRRKRPGIRLHRSGRLAPEEVTVHEDIPTTTVARTLLDLADVLPTQALKRAIDESERQRLFDLTSLLAAVQNNPGRRGAKGILELAREPPELTDSEFEDAFLALVELHGLPRPRVGVWIDGYRADFLWADERVIVETDGFGAHGTRRAFEHDRRRDRRLAAAGFQTVRVTKRALRYEEDAIVADLEALLSRSRASSNPSSRSRISAASAT
jgi:very-short-patch-repair endonuclease